jgi:hypothetical protein
MKKDPQFGDFGKLFMMNFLKQNDCFWKLQVTKELMENYPDGKHLYK